MRLYALVAAAALSACCGNQDIVKQDLTMYNKWHHDSAKHIRSIVKTCECNNGMFVDPECQKAADLALVLEARADWHYKMSLFNLDVTDVRPDRDPPKIAPVTCPLPEPAK